MLKRENRKFAYRPFVPICKYTLNIYIYDYCRALAFIYKQTYIYLYTCASSVEYNNYFVGDKNRFYIYCI